MTYTIQESPIHLIAKLGGLLPEFENAYTETDILLRLADKPYLSLVAFADGEPVGFKLGYERDGYFYSWLGGVLPHYRRSGIAQALADTQEAWAFRNGYNSVTFKTRNRHKAMLLFALKNGFHIIGFELREPLEESRIWLRKQLTYNSSSSAVFYT